MTPPSEAGDRGKVLPVASPACLHRWARDERECCYICEGCGYTLTDVELLDPHEGED